MADEDQNPLELDVVARRFAESADALESVRRSLKTLAELQTDEERSRTELRNATSQVYGFVEEAAAAVRGLEESRATVARDTAGMLKALQEAQQKMTEALSAATDLLDGTELKGITESVKANSEAISTIGEGVNVLESKVSEMPDKVNVEIKRVAEFVEANAKAISRVVDRVEALEGKVERDMAELKEKMEMVHAAAKTPLIKRLF